ncbi:type I-E CRISPR-associated protein Cse1/CasA [Saccharothrix longispora]|uniref:CRISPR system Cascade subunit CasA n=1 Tax=Saccharothrix longispora TaxID=33920 RepID=A0ABU1PV55_9PSEU|nr:type I-E CRISPR-associated protein Cse1/CasA [Saccharothrix longispora]MDR6594530.1 CRISPR system Cascade subunit CasA [Saccharothrix longispora]
MTREAATSFDLLTERWIPVIDRNGTPDKVGLRRLLLDSHMLRRISGSTSPMTAALYRLVLALFHRAYAVTTEVEWKDRWEAESLPAEPLEQYLAEFGDRFDLFDTRRPFLQCPALARIAPQTPAKLIPHRAVGNNVTLFDHTTASDITLLDPDEAACWLVTTQAFDPGGTKTPYEGVRSSKLAPCNRLGVVLVEGDTLLQTLLFNALFYDPELHKPRKTTPDDAPVWEATVPPPGIPDKRPARGWTDLLTWPSRRILLTHRRDGDATKVDGVVITPGVEFTGELVHDEKMAAFRQPTGTNGKPKEDVPLQPIRLAPLRGVWRHSVELLLADQPGEGRSRMRPPALDQIARLAERGRLPQDASYTLCVFGQLLNKEQSVVVDYLEDAVPAPVALLRAEEPVLATLVGTAIALADDAGAALRHLESDYREERRAKPVSGLDLAYWPRLPNAFAELLEGMATARRERRPETDALTAWAEHVADTACSAGNRWAHSASTDGRDLLVIAKHVEKFDNIVAKLVRTFQVKVRGSLTKEQDG